MASQPRDAELTAAFHDFNRLSSALESSYRDLEGRVAALTGELAQARRERFEELEARARLASRLEQMLALLPGAVLVVDAAGIVREANRGADALLGQPLIATPVTDVLGRLCREAVAGSGEFETATGLRIGISRRPLEAEPGEIILITDVTEAVRLRTWLEREKRLSTLGEAAALLAHQIRTPLSAALLYTNRLANPEIAPTERAEVARKVVGRLRHLEGQVADMLAYARGGGGSFVPCDVNGLLENVAQNLASKLEHGAKLTVRTFVTATKVRANPEALIGALVNLAANGLEAAGTGAEVVIEASRVAERIHLRVRDNGPGVAEALRDQIFEPFYTTRSHGTGLGLAVVRSVARAHGGEAVLERSESGASFLIDLPANPETP